MGWLLSLVVACLSGALGLVAAGVLADQAVGWYQISSFEGGSGFFVIGMALLGLAGGFVVGLVVARVVAAYPRPGFARALGLASLSVFALIMLVAVPARLLADIPPLIDGEELRLLVEFRWPLAGAAAPDPAGIGRVRLAAASASVIRVSEDGPLFLDAARQDEGRWIVPGVAPIFTSRGSRVLELVIGEQQLAGFIVPLAGHPGPETFEWSVWMPRPAEGAAPLPDQFSYRYRVIRASQPIRSDRIGAFEIETISRSFFDVGNSDRMASDSTFLVRRDGQPMAGDRELTGIAVVGDRAALIAETRDSACLLIRAEPPAAEPLEDCGILREGRPLTNDARSFAAGRDSDVVPGWVDRRTMSEPGLYRLGHVVVDARRLTATDFKTPDEVSVVSSVPPLAVSPDERRFAWFAYAGGSDETPALVVTNWQTSQSELLRIDPDRMRFPDAGVLDPAWVAHHFEWVPADDGQHHLRERASFVPLPYRGTVTLGEAGAYQSYAVTPGSEELRKALVSVLVDGMRGERLPDELNGYQQRVRVRNTELSVTVGESPSYVSVYTLAGPPEVMTEVAAALDAALATGQYDAMIAAARKVRPN